MKRFLITLAASALGFALAIGALGYFAVQAFVGPHIAEAAMLRAPFAAEIPPELQGFKDLAPTERFGHFFGGQLRFSDTGSQAHTVSVVPGTVTALSDKSVTINANDPSLGSKSYNLTTETRIHQAGGRPWGSQNGQGSSATMKSGDQVVVVSLDNSSDARAVMIGGLGGFHPQGGPWRRG
jgi:hypothetical protein